MSMLRSISGWLARLKLPTLVAVGVLEVLLAIYVFGSAVPAIRAETGNADFEIVDAYYLRPPSTTFANLEALGSKGRSIYLRIAAADVFIPIGYATLLGAWMAKVWRVSPTPMPHESQAWMLPLLPVASAAADYVENACTLYHMARLPQHDVGVAWVGSAATFLKYTLMAACAPLLLLGWLTQRRGGRRERVF